MDSVNEKGHWRDCNEDLGRRLWWILTGKCCILGITLHRSLHFVRDKVNSSVSVPVFPDGAGAQWDLKSMCGAGWPAWSPSLCRACVPCCLVFGTGARRAAGHELRASPLLWVDPV